MSDIPRSLHEEVVLRAGNRCEYCKLSQLGQGATFHIDHVILESRKVVWEHPLKPRSTIPLPP